MQRALIICLALATSIVSPRARAETPAKPRQRLILCDDGGSLGAPNMEAPIGIEGLVRAAIDPLRDTMIDTLYWQIGTDPYFGTPTHRLTEWYSHDTKVGPRWGEDRQTFATAGEWRIYENARQIMEQGIDPVEVVIRHGHEAGLDVFVSLRFNDHHDAGLPKGLDDPNMSPLKREHPDWLIGGKGYYRKSLNFAVPEVRAYSLALMKETIENYDLDGLDIDFCRWPVLFREGEAANGATHVTGIVRRVRGMLDDKARKAGRRLHLSVRVPGSLANAGKAGIDVGTWIRDGLRLLVEQLTARDVLECRLNGRPLDFQGAVRHLNYNDCWLDLDATAALRQGFNDVEITVLSRNPHVTSPLVLRAAEALVTYADAAR